MASSRAKVPPRSSVPCDAVANRRRRGARWQAWVLAALVASLAVTSTEAVNADELAVPLPVQAELLTKAAVYDRNFAERANGLVRVLIVARPGDILSERMANQMAAALRAQATIGGLPHTETLATASDAQRIAPLVREHRAAIVYVAPGYGEADVHAIAASLAGADVLSAGALSSYVPWGIVLGFDVSAGHPTLLANLGQARRQHVQFAARLVKLMRTYQ